MNASMDVLINHNATTQRNPKPDLVGFMPVNSAVCLFTELYQAEADVREC